MLDAAVTSTAATAYCYWYHCRYPPTTMADVFLLTITLAPLTHLYIPLRNPPLPLLLIFTSPLRTGTLPHPRRRTAGSDTCPRRTCLRCAISRTRTSCAGPSKRRARATHTRRWTWSWRCGRCESTRALHRFSAVFWCLSVIVRCSSAVICRYQLLTAVGCCLSAIPM